MKITFDFETRSACDLKKCGAFKYSTDPTTRPTCLAYKIDDDETKLLDFQRMSLPFKKLPSSFQTEWLEGVNSGALFIGHNVFFETVLYKNILVKRFGWPDIPFRQFRCTAAKAAACALPRSLEGAGTALNLTTQKDRDGFFAMMMSCRPTRDWTAWNKAGRKGKAPVQFISPKSDPEVFETLYRYCKIDVETERLLDKTLPDLTAQELEVWFLNQQMNWRGLAIDIPLVEKIVKIMNVETSRKSKDLDTLTLGLITKPGAVKAIREFLLMDGIELPDLRAKTVSDALKDGKLTADGKALLELRQALSKTSTKKYQAMLDRANDDGRVRDILLYHGASTGRDSGVGVQFQNLMRPVIFVDPDRPYAAVENVEAFDADMLKTLYGENLAPLFSSIIRNMLIPTKGKKLYVADFAKIEVAVCWWLANNEKGLNILRSGKDPYVYQAAANTGKKYEDVNEEERQLGKMQVLGCQFGTGATKFQSIAWDIFRVRLTEEQSKAAVTSYREINFQVPDLWKKYERAALEVVRNPSQKIKIGKCIFSMKNKFLWVELPSGRKLAYREPRIEMKDSGFGPRPSLEFLGLGLDKKSLRYERTWGGTLTENIVQAVARDLMKFAELNLERAKYQVLVPVHDEIISEAAKGSVEEYVKIMTTRPAWADDKLPLDAKGYCAKRYRK